MSENSFMKNGEEQIFGRKVFFINPSIKIRYNVIPELRSEEYEAFMIKDYRLVKSILRDNPNALALINIDNALTFGQWYNFIRSFEEEEVLKTIRVGVLCSKMSSEKERLLKNLNLTCGIIELETSSEVLEEKIKQVLVENGAKGRRQYIRLDCKNLKLVKAYFYNDEKLYSLEVDNISSVGFAGTYSQEITSILQEKFLKQTFTLHVGRKIMEVPCVIFDTRIRDGRGLSVLLFTKEVPLEVRKTIRSFIFEVLDEVHYMKLKQAEVDETEYSRKIPEVEEARKAKQFVKAYMSQLFRAV